MAVCNIVTDVALILMPFPVLRQSTLTTRQYVGFSPDPSPAAHV